MSKLSYVIYSLLIITTVSSRGTIPCLKDEHCEYGLQCMKTENQNVGYDIQTLIMYQPHFINIK